ncbi:MAG: hypothetical protein P4M11_13585 [Candidatus Pacebacteria bacterium]|nr:hypothetical protein [Candidatus Paceibacterota bacterium]
MRFAAFCVPLLLLCCASLSTCYVVEKVKCAVTVDNSRYFNLKKIFK